MGWNPLRFVPLDSSYFLPRSAVDSRVIRMNRLISYLTIALNEASELLKNTLNETQYYIPLPSLSGV